MRKQYAQYFKTAKRTDGTVFVNKTHDAPEDLIELIRSIHKDYFFDSIPNDWIYDQIYEAFCELSEYDIEDLALDPDIYNSQLYKWFGNSYADQYCAEYAEEIGFNQPKNIWDQIRGGQWLAKDRIYRAVSDFINQEPMENNNE